MAYYLIIDTALEKGIVVLAHENSIIDTLINNDQKNHATWLHNAIENILNKNKINIKQINIIGVTIGPGSFTGIRIGLSAAKGFCFSLNIPMVTLNTLQAITVANTSSKTTTYIPMIDARRDEVYTCMYDENFNIIKDPYSLIIDKECFIDDLEKQCIVFCGNGAYKLNALLSHPNAIFSNTEYTSDHLFFILKRQLNDKLLIDYISQEPLYIKNNYLKK